MNTILPTGVSRLNTASSKFNLESGSVLIGLNAGTQLEELDNVFVGNSAGADSTYVSESIFLGIYAGQHIRTGKKNIIIGDDKSSTYLDKTNILSIGFNNIDRESVGIGSNITCVGSNNILVGRNIQSDSHNSYAYGKDINIRNTNYFIDTMMNVNTTSTLAQGFNAIGLIDIITATDYNASNIFHIQYDVNNNIKIPDTMFNRETDFILKFKPTDANFNFNIAFNIGTCNLVNFNFKNNLIAYTNNAVALEFPIYYNITLDNPFVYDEYNIIHIINNDKVYKTLSIYINPYYNNYTVSEKSRNYNDLGFIANIRNNNVDNIKISYSLDNNKINSNYLFSYHSDIKPDYYGFNNASASISFNSFVVAVNDSIAKDIYNITYGRDINIKGTNNICIGDKQTVAGDNSILIGRNISAYKTYKNSRDSIVIGNDNFAHNYSKDVILIGNNNFNFPISNTEQYAEFLNKRPIILGSDISNYDYTLNIGNSIVKYDTNSNTMLLLGMQKELLPVAIGFASNTDIPLKEFYEFSYDSNVYYEYENSNVVSNYFVDGIMYEDVRTYVITHELMDVQITNNIVFNDERNALYVKQGIYSDGITLYNGSNFAINVKTDEKIKQNIKYTLPDLLDADEYSKKTPLLSYKYGSSSNAALFWGTLEDTLRVIDIYSKNVVSSGYIYSSDFVGIGSNLNAVNLDDRNTSLLKEGSNLYYTAQRTGAIAKASNIISMNYTLATCNEIMHTIQTLNTNNIQEFNRLYYTDERFDNRLLDKTLDNIYNGTSNQFITNGIFTRDMLITGTLTVGKIQVLGIDFPHSMGTVAFASTADVAVLTEQIRVLSQTVASINERLA